MAENYNGLDESHRLKPMVEGYDKNLLNQLWKETRALRKKLAYDIDARKFGVDYKEILSCFDVKFLYAFNKYHKDPKVKGYVINALRTYKHRCILNSYLPKNEIHQTMDIEDTYDVFDIADDIKILSDEDNLLLDKAQNYLKSILSEDAYFLFELDLNPPPYILERLKNSEQKKMPKPSADLIAEFLGISDSDYATDYIKQLRKEIDNAIQRANQYFNPKLKLG